MVVAEYFSHHFEEHVGELTGVLKEKLDTMADALEREFGTTVEKMWRPKATSLCGSSSLIGST